jgi:hypothetical protein
MNQLPEPEWIFPFDSLNVGDSFFIPTLRPSEMLFVIDNRAKAAGIKIKAYASSKDGRLGVRVWRVA